MSCLDLMWADPPVLSPDHRVEDATHSLLRARVRSLPVVDSSGTLVGMFGIHQLLTLMVPKAANMENGLRNVAFVNDNVSDLKRRLSQAGDKTVGDLMTTEFQTVTKEMPLTKVVQLLHQGHESLPVASEETGEFLGLISYWLVLKAVSEIE